MYRPLACWDCGFESHRGHGCFVCCDCCVLLGRGLCDELIIRPEESYRMWCVVVCDLESSWMRRPWSTGGGAVAPPPKKNNVYLSQWPRGQRRGSAVARLLGLWVRIPPGAWMFVCCECCVYWQNRRLCVGLITLPEESYRVGCVWIWSWTLDNK